MTPLIVPNLILGKKSPKGLCSVTKTFELFLTHALTCIRIARAAETTAKGPDLLLTCGRVGIKKLQTLCRTGLFQLSYISMVQDH